jgi:hypothetical protein
MKKGLVSSFAQLQKMLPPGVSPESEPARASALKHYLSKGGVLRIAPEESGWPKLLYPTKIHLRKKIDETRALRSQYYKRLESWQQKFDGAKNYHSLHNLKKLKEPLFWRHVAKCAVDPGYKSDAARVKLPVHLVADSRWKPMVKTFISDQDYRKQLVQTVDESIVYKNDKRVAQYADQLQGFRMEQSNRKIEELAKKLEALDADITAMQELTRWASF